MKVLYNPKLKALSRKLRKQGVLSEVLLGEQLKDGLKKIYRINSPMAPFSKGEITCVNFY